MKIPPFNEIEPLPPVPSCRKDLEDEVEEIAFTLERMDDEIKPVDSVLHDSREYKYASTVTPINEHKAVNTTECANRHSSFLEPGIEAEIEQGEPDCNDLRSHQRPHTAAAADVGDEENDDDTAAGSTRVDTNCYMSLRAFERAEEFAKRIWAAGWMVVHHKHLPKWLKDNDFLVKGHRPPMNSFWKCFKSVFRVHTETGNIWTHLLGFIAFIAIAVYFVSRPSSEIEVQEKAVFSAFFSGAILCLLFSWMFHTVYCHSENVGRFFNKLDYCGIAMLTMGSFVPWLYYSFYCRPAAKITYLVVIFILGTTCIIVSMFDKFAAPKFRPVRAGVFIGLGLSGVIPAMHVVATDGFWSAVLDSALGWLSLMAILYIVGALIYAARIPERIWPGRFDIWCQSHQIFHMFVLAAALVHYHGISQIARNRLSRGDCHLFY